MCFDVHRWHVPSFTAASRSSVIIFSFWQRFSARKYRLSVFGWLIFDKLFTVYNVVSWIRTIHWYLIWCIFWVNWTANAKLALLTVLIRQFCFRLSLHLHGFGLFRHAARTQIWLLPSEMRLYAFFRLLSVSVHFLRRVVRSDFSLLCFVDKNIDDVWNGIRLVLRLLCKSAALGWWWRCLLWLFLFRFSVRKRVKLLRDVSGFEGRFHY